MKKNVHTWVGIRSSIPKRVWKKCIEYTVTDKNGNKEIYSVDENTGIRTKVRSCGIYLRTTVYGGSIQLGNIVDSNL